MDHFFSISTHPKFAMFEWTMVKAYVISTYPKFRVCRKNNRFHGTMVNLLYETWQLPPNNIWYISCVLHDGNFQSTFFCVFMYIVKYHHNKINFFIFAIWKNYLNWHVKFTLIAMATLLVSTWQIYLSCSWKIYLYGA